MSPTTTSGGSTNAATRARDRRGRPPGRPPLRTLDPGVMNTRPFDVWEPSHGETPVVVEVPHAGLQMDPASMAFSRAPVQALARDADLFVDELAQDAPDEGASLIVSRMSRYEVDLNRDPDETDYLAVEGAAGESKPWGVLWRSTTGGDPALDGPVRTIELERRLALTYWPYHQALDAMVQRKLRRFGVVVLLSLHSMPSDPLQDVASRRRLPDVVIGTQRKTTASPGLVAEVERLARAQGWSVGHDDPYAGGATTRRHGQPEQGRHAIQLELARRLYMNERTCVQKAHEFAAIRALCRRLVARLGAIALR